jgi:ssDNA-binding Zn-finger/Zn-ribbon topoisomerase 1
MSKLTAEEFYNKDRKHPIDFDNAQQAGDWCISPERCVELMEAYAQEKCEIKHYECMEEVTKLYHKIEQLREFLKESKCPDCDYTQMNNELVIENCEWCDKRSKQLKSK